MKWFSLLLTALCLLPALALAAAPVSPVFRGGTFDPGNVLYPQPQSGTEALLISFYRNSGRTPDFKRWSFMTRPVLKAAEYDRNVIALNEQVRLQTAFQNTDPSDYLIIHAPIDVTNYSATQEVLFLPTFAGTGTLTQQIYGEKMAIIIGGLKQFEKIAMSNAQASFFYNLLKQSGRPDVSIPVFAELVVRPKQTIFSKEGRVGKGDHYLFFVELAQITLWRKATNDKQENMTALWTWKADWYETGDDNADLLQLYRAIN